MRYKLSEVARMLGVSKNTIVYRFASLPDEMKEEDEKGRRYVTEEGLEELRKHFTKLDEERSEIPKGSDDIKELKDTIDHLTLIVESFKMRMSELEKDKEELKQDKQMLKQMIESQQITIDNLTKTNLMLMLNDKKKQGIFARLLKKPSDDSNTDKATDNQ